MGLGKKIEIYIRNKKTFTAGGVALDLGIDKKTVALYFIHNPLIGKVPLLAPTQFRHIDEHLG